MVFPASTDTLYPGYNPPNPTNGFGGGSVRRSDVVRLNKNRYVLALCMISHNVWQVFDSWGAWLDFMYMLGMC